MLTEKSKGNFLCSLYRQKLYSMGVSIQEACQRERLVRSCTGNLQCARCRCCNDGSLADKGRSDYNFYWSSND